MDTDHVQQPMVGHHWTNFGQTSDKLGTHVGQTSCRIPSESCPPKYPKPTENCPKKGPKSTQSGLWRVQSDPLEGQNQCRSQAQAINLDKLSCGASFFQLFPVLDVQSALQERSRAPQERPKSARDGILEQFWAPKGYPKGVKIEA